MGRKVRSIISIHVLLLNRLLCSIVSNTPFYILSIHVLLLNRLMCSIVSNTPFYILSIHDLLPTRLLILMHVKHPIP